jgi:hypothetical protein
MEHWLELWYYEIIDFFRYSNDNVFARAFQRSILKCLWILHGAEIYFKTSKLEDGREDGHIHDLGTLMRNMKKIKVGWGQERAGVSGN